MKKIRSFLALSLDFCRFVFSKVLQRGYKS